MKIRIIVATHKKYQMPQDEMYLPLHVGAEGKTDEKGNKLDLGYAKDNTGVNISSLNPEFCELTALYWGWKNLDVDYMGLVHYRRVFVSGYNGKNTLTYTELEPLLEKYSVIVPRKRHYYIENMYSHYEHTHDKQHLDEARKIICKKYGEYISAFDSVMKQRSGYMFNMMIMKKELLNEYCEWLFDILFELKKCIETSNLSFYEGRLYGRVSEILFNVWLQYQMDTGKLGRNDIHELPYIYMEQINWRKKIISFLQAKFFHKKYEASF